MYKYLILLLIAGTILQSCESSEVVDVSIDGTERVVVEGVLFSGRTFEGVKITRTLPSGYTYDIKQAEIKDAYAYLLINGIQVIPLHYTSSAIYNSYSELRVEAGSTYELYAYIKNEKVYAKTVIPYMPNLISAKYNNSGYFQATVQARSSEVYGAIWVVLSSVTKKANNFFSIEASDGSNSSPVITRTTVFDEDYLDPYYSNKRRIQVYAFDEQYAPYFNNSAKNILAENNVLTGGSGVAWNIKGKNVIGMFIGVAEGGIEGEF